MIRSIAIIVPTVVAIAVALVVTAAAVISTTSPAPSRVAAKFVINPVFHIIPPSPDDWCSRKYLAACGEKPVCQQRSVQCDVTASQAYRS